MRKFFLFVTLSMILIASSYYAFIYYASFSQGYRAGELVKFSNKGLLFKTWEGELSFGVSEAQRFEFSVEDIKKDVIDQLVNMQGEEIKITYKERFATFPWLGDTKYYVIKVERQNKIIDDKPRDIIEISR